MSAWGYAFLGSVGVVAAMARNDEYAGGPQGFGGVARRAVATYAEMGRVLSRPAVRRLGLVLLTSRAAFAAFIAYEFSVAV